MVRKFTVEEIDQQIAKLQDQRAVLQKAERSEVIAKMKVAIAHYQVTAEELGLSGSASPAKKAPKATAKSAAKAPAAEKRGGRIKYKDDAGHTWSGFGPKPRWLVEALASGKTEADLRA